MTKKYEPVWDGHLSWITVAKQCIVLNLPDATPIHLAPYHAGAKHKKLEREEVYKLREACVAEPALLKWTPFIVSVSKNDGYLRFA